MQAHVRIICILIAQIATFIPHIPCIQENICSQKLWREPFFLPTIYSVVSVSFKVKPTSHVNMIKLAMAVLWESKNLWSYIVHFFCCCVSFTTILSCLWRLVSLLVIQTSFPCFIHASLWFHILHLLYFMFAFSRVFQYWQNLEGHLYIKAPSALFPHIVSSSPLWCVRWSTFPLTNSTGNGATIKQSERRRLFQWMCVRRNCHSSSSAAVRATNCSVDVGKV